MTETTPTDRHDGESPAPTVFISYSHDSPEHKMWVAGLARDLRQRGIDAILDQWELAAGMDAAHYMEKGIRDANRVLIFCTPPYAHKADAGEGGVGYEKMIVTGELYQDLGSSKFIPLLVRGDKQDALPSFLKSRIFIDFREDDHYEEGLVELLRVLHEVPKDLKPPLGPNPFSGSNHAAGTGDSASDPLRVGPVPLTRASAMKPEKVYETCQALLRRNDVVGWRELAKMLRKPIADNLLAWRTQYDTVPPKTWDDVFKAVDDALSRVMPVISMALAGVESRMAAFVDQRSVFDDLTRIPGWHRSGRTILVEVPGAIGYVFHYLHGATCMATGQVGVALSLATMSVQLYRSAHMVRLWQDAELTAYPETLQEDCVQAWRYLKSALERFSWLERVFGTKTDYQAALCAYSMVLSALELADATTKENCEQALASAEANFEVIPLYAGESPDIIAPAFALAFRDSMSVKMIAESANADPVRVRNLWPAWLRHVEKYRRRLCGGRHHAAFEGLGIDRLP